MNPVDQSRRRRIRPVVGRGRLLLSAVVLSALAGCEGLGSRQYDPMLGIHAPTTTAPAPAAPSSAPAQTASAPAQTPPLPASYTAPGPATVASGEMAAPEKARDLRMTTDSPSSASLPSGGAARGTAPGVTVGNPEPATTDTSSRLAPAPVANSPLQQIGASAPAPTPTFVGTAANIKTFDEAQQFLKQRGVTWQRLDMEDDGRWKFECSLRKSANVNSHYVPDTSFADPLSAIRAVIVKIENDPR